MLFKVCPFYLVVAYEPQFRVRVPPSSRRFGLFPQRVFHKTNLHGHERVVGKPGGRRRSCFFLYDDFRCLDPCAAFPVVPVAHADESGAVFSNQLFRPLLSRFQLQPRYHSVFCCVKLEFLPSRDLLPSLQLLRRHEVVHEPVGLFQPVQLGLCGGVFELFQGLR